MYYEPHQCPNCHAVWLPDTNECPACGYPDNVPETDADQPPVREDNWQPDELYQPLISPFL
ncbi:eL43 family ribosomal protein [Limnovirga soli]|uniref:Uncharacterized protein n=1 Tax=Limnovirga soli TaxID=2656915 RepID=A0A8J8JSX9_9BACT|nr:hypothetical protein [Limnovirga soli]NNV54560.1 hypothetical protein [Limnovirga soli]